MAEELQGLLNRIHEEGVKKADSEKEKIISEAKAKAQKIVEDAKKEAESLRKKAEEDASGSEARAKSAIQQAARDIILSLKEDLLERLNKVTKEAAGDAMTPDVMGGIILEMVKAGQAKGSSEEPALDVLVNPKDLEKMESLLKGSLLKDLKETPEISAGKDFSAGLKIGFKGNDVFFDFSDETLAELICQFIGPKLAEMLNNK